VLPFSEVAVRQVLTLLLGALLLGGLWESAVAADWGGITPGMSTHTTVRDRYGAPSRESRQTLEGYETIQWVYEGPRAPVGMKRMVVDFGLLTPKGYQPGTVRSFRLEPKPRIFLRRAVVHGWGPPDRVGVPKGSEGSEVFFYTSGLLVYFNEDGTEAISMVFTAPQPESSTPQDR